MFSLNVRLEDSDRVLLDKIQKATLLNKRNAVTKCIREYYDYLVDNGEIDEDENDNTNKFNNYHRDTMIAEWEKTL